MITKTSITQSIFASILVFIVVADYAITISGQNNV
jgi:hypothetical protein